MANPEKRKQQAMSSTVRHVVALFILGTGFFCILGYTIRSLQIKQREQRRLFKTDEIVQTVEVDSGLPRSHVDHNSLIQRQKETQKANESFKNTMIDLHQKKTTDSSTSNFQTPTSSAKKHLSKKEKQRLNGDAKYEVVFGATWAATEAVVEHADDSETIHFDDKATVCVKDMEHAAKLGEDLFFVFGEFESQDIFEKKTEHSFLAVVYRLQSEDKFTTHALLIDEKTVFLTPAVANYLRKTDRNLKDLRRVATTIPASAP